MDFLSALILATAPGAVVPFVRPYLSVDELGSDEPELVQNAIAGQRAAQHALYVRHYQRVRARIGRLLGRSGEVDDVLQDTFVFAFRDLKQLNDGARFGNWVCGIAVHQVHRRLRRRKLLQRLGFDQKADELTLTQAADPAASPETQLLLKQLDHALTALAPRQRVAWMLRYVEGCSLDEVASQCRASLATVKRDIAQAELHLHAQLLDPGSPDER
jgi:RNA polymerase sigma-70 factor (ECF subfamily)